MAAVLVALPPYVVSENIEATNLLAASSEAYRKKQLEELGAQTLLRKEDKGAFRGTLLYSWKENFSAILQTTYIVSAGKVQSKEFARVSSLIRREDCIHLGSKIEIEGDAPTGTPRSALSKNNNLRSVIGRTFETVSPIRLDTELTGTLATRFAPIYDALMSEDLSAQSLPVNAWTARLACKWAPKSIDLGPLKNDYPARAHRVLITRLTLSGKETDWPKAVGHAFFHNGIFGEPSKPVFEWKKETPLNPSEFTSIIVTESKNIAHNMKQESFRVLKRDGRWVYLDRGRAYGLQIGMHLLGPNGSELHVIQFNKTTDENPDVAIAFVRKESSSNPVKSGDSVTFDLRPFPVAGTK